MPITIKILDDEIKNLKLVAINTVYDNLFLSENMLKRVYEGIFYDTENNDRAGLYSVTGETSLFNTIRSWLDNPNETDNKNKRYMFFLMLDDEPVGTLTSFTTSYFGDGVTLGYIVSPKHQGKGLGKKMLKSAVRFLVDELRIPNIYLGIRDWNHASERMATACGFKYYTRTQSLEPSLEPMTYYKYSNSLNESISPLDSKMLLSNQWILVGDKILSRVSPKMISIDEYAYLCNASAKPVAFKESYFVFSSLNYNTQDILKKEKIKGRVIGITDDLCVNKFKVDYPNDINTDDLFKLTEGDLTITDRNDTHLILSNKLGELKVRVVDELLLIEDFIINK